MKKVYTSIKTLKEVKRVMNDIGLQEIISEDGKSNINLLSILNQLLDENKLVELLQIITRDKKTKFEDMELSEIKEILSHFFGNIVGLLPDAVTKAFKMETALKQQKTSS